MTRNLVALYNDLAVADKVVQDLKNNGFAREDISIAAQDPSGQQGYTVTTDDVSGSEGAGFGAVVGGLTGLVVGLGALAIPGIGPIIAAGPLAAALGGVTGAAIGAGTGAITGGLTAALVHMGLPEESAGSYAEGVRRGHALVTVRAADTMIDAATAIMRQYGPVDIEAQSTEWHQQGWTGFNPNGDAYSSDEIAPALTNTYPEPTVDPLADTNQHKVDNTKVG
ncbi:MAG: general stress protein [Chloroflexota bacterium]